MGAQLVFERDDRLGKVDAVLLEVRGSFARVPSIDQGVTSIVYARVCTRTSLGAMTSAGFPLQLDGKLLRLLLRAQSPSDEAHEGSL